MSNKYTDQSVHRPGLARVYISSFLVLWDSRTILSSRQNMTRLLGYSV